MSSAQRTPAGFACVDLQIKAVFLLKSGCKSGSGFSFPSAAAKRSGAAGWTFGSGQTRAEPVNVLLLIKTKVPVISDGLYWIRAELSACSTSPLNPEKVQVQV